MRSRRSSSRSLALRMTFCDSEPPDLLYCFDCQLSHGAQVHTSKRVSIESALVEKGHYTGTRGYGCGINVAEQVLGPEVQTKPTPPEGVLISHGMLPQWHHYCRNWDLYLSCLVAAAATAEIWLVSPPGPSRFLVGMSMSLLIPGYLLATLLFPCASDMDGIERIAVSCALSIVVLVVVELALAEFHVMLTAKVEIVALNAVVLALACGVAWRRSAVSVSRRYIPRFPRGVVPSVTLCFVAALGVATWWIVGNDLGAVEPAFYLSNARGMMAGYPARVQAGSRQWVYVNVDNPTRNAMSFHVIERSGRKPVAIATATVGASKHWVRRMLLPSSGRSRHLRIGFRLIHDRDVFGVLWIKYRIIS
jgi:uncharacterized membrane protein